MASLQELLNAKSAVADRNRAKDWSARNRAAFGGLLNVNEFLPVTGDIQSGILAAQDLGEGAYGSAALNALGLLPFVPAMGGVVKKARKAEKTQYEIAQDVAQKNAALPISEGGLGLPANNTAIDRAKAMGFNTPAYHYSRADEPFDSFIINTASRDTSFLDGLGVHSGTKEAAEDRFKQYWKGTKQNPSGYTLPVLLSDDSQLVKKSGVPYTESELKRFLTKKAIDTGLPDPAKSRDAQIAIRNAISKKYDIVPYVNKIEGAGDVSYLTSNPAKIRSSFAAFDPMRRNDADLLAGIGGASLAGLLGLSLLDQQQYD